MAEGVRRIPIAQGNVCNGTLFLPQEKTFGSGPYPLAVQLLGGIQKGKVLEDQSALITARAGVACFSMAYFGVNNLPKYYLGYDTSGGFTYVCALFSPKRLMFSFSPAHSHALTNAQK